MNLKGDFAKQVTLIVLMIVGVNFIAFQDGVLQHAGAGLLGAYVTLGHFIWRDAE